ncbi:TPA: hypothetical protein ACH3X1_012112 [Trebouxia sp. C0004]
MILRTASAFLLLLFVSGLHGVRCQNEPPSPETKSTFELAKENTIQKHTGVNVTTGEDIVSSANMTSNATEMLYQALAPSDAPSTAPGNAAEPFSEPASRPSEAPIMAPALAPAALSGALQITKEDTSADAVPTQTPAGTPAVGQPPLNSTIDAAIGTIGGAVDKDAITRGAGVASSSRYGSVIAGTLVAAVVVVGIAGTVLVWRRRAGAYQGLHDTEMAMIRREH